MVLDAAQEVDGRLTFQEQMRLVELPDIVRGGLVIKRYMSRRSAWVPGCDLPIQDDAVGSGEAASFRGKAAYGAHVYSQAGLAASRAFADIRKNNEVESMSRKQFGIHVSP